MQSDRVQAGPQALSDDLLELICVQASLEDRYCAYALALTCRKVCRWTAKARWNTVVLTSVRQLLSFWRAIYAVPDDIFHAFRLQYEKSCTGSEQDFSQAHMTVAANSAFKLSDVHERKSEGVSFPADGQPHRYVRNLYIDLSHEEAAAGSVPAHKVLSKCCLIFLATGTFMRSSALADPRNILKRWSGKDRTPLNVVSLGIDETDAVNWSHLGDISIRELTIVLRKDYSGDLHIDMTPSVERLHIIGADPESEITGVEPPWTLFKSLTTPILKDGLSPLPKLTHRKITHLRYDTRRFSLKPAEIFAKRLRPLLQEVTVAPSVPGLGAEDDQQASPASSFQFQGPRHAAPARGAGSYLRNLQQSRLTPVAYGAAAGDAISQYLQEIGVGKLDLLQFAWEPMGSRHTLTTEPLPWYKRSLDSVSSTTEASTSSIPSFPRRAQTDDNIDAMTLMNETGGWPLEKRGAWTERSEKSTALASFAVELRDAISTLYGWHAPGIEAARKYCAAVEDRERKAVSQADAAANGNEDTNTASNALPDKNVAFSPDGTGLMIEPIQPGLTPQDEEELRSLALLVKDQVPSWRNKHPDWAEDDLDFLRMGVRAPRSLLHLGGRAAFHPSDRILFFEDRARGGRGPWP